MASIDGSVKDDLASLPSLGSDGSLHLNEEEAIERQAEIVRLEEQLLIERKIKQGAERLRATSMQKSESISKEEVELQIKAADAKISALSKQITELQQSKRSSGGRRRIQRTDSHHSNMSYRRSVSSSNISVPMENPHKRAPSVGSAPMFSRQVMFEAVSRTGLSVGLQEILASLKKGELTALQRLESLNRLAMFYKLTPNFEDYNQLEPVALLVRVYLADAAKEVRAAAYRVLRHMLAEVSTAQLLVRLHIEHFLVRSLLKEVRVDAEREQALKLVRTWIAVPEGGAQCLPKSVVACILSVVGSEDKLAPLCLETVYELAIFNLPLLADAGGIHVIFTAMLDMPAEYMPTIVSVITLLLDREDTRKYIRAGVDLEVILSPFTDVFARGTNHEQRLIASAHAVVALLKSWTGILYLCIENKLALRSLVEALLLPYEELKRVMLDMFFEIFRARAPQWSADFLSAMRRTVDYHRIGDERNGEWAQSSRNASGARPVVVNHYLAIVLVAFIDAGLLDALVELMKDPNNFLQVRATILLGEVIALANALLPKSYSTPLQSLPKLFELGATFGDEVLRNSATSAISHLEKLHRVKEQFAVASDQWRRPFHTHTIINSRQDRIQKQLSHMKIVMGIAADDVQFGNLTRDSLLLSERSYAKWNWDSICELLQGPLMNPRRIDETVNNKLLKKLLSFYLPQSRQFSDIMIDSPQAAQYVRVGCQLVQTLLSTAEGAKFFSEQDFLPQIAHALEQLDPISEKTTEELLFSPERMTSTLTSEYFTFLGILTSVPAGREILKRHNVYTLFYFLTELKSRDDIARAIISCLDYSEPGHTRIILSKVLTASSPKSRAFATNYLRTILRQNLPGFADWGVRLLHSQVYDPSFEVGEVALKVLEEACSKNDCLETLVGLRPTYEYLGEVATPLLLRIMSHPKGLEFLTTLDYVDKVVTEWQQDGMLRYVHYVELSLARALAAPVNTGTSSLLAPRSRDNLLYDIAVDDDGSLPPHLCGELTATKAGCAVLKLKGSMDRLVAAVRAPAASLRTNDDVLRVKAALWALGHMGSTQLGIAFLEEASVMPDIVAVAESSPVLSLRGTAFYALGLIARTQAGADLLEESGWEAIADPDRVLRGLALPKDSGKLLSVAPCEAPGSWAATAPVAAEAARAARVLDSWDPVSIDTLSYIVNLSNAVATNAASKNLTKIKAENPDVFLGLPLYAEMFQLLTNYNYRVGSRRFVVELFDRVQFGEEFFAMLDSPDAGADAAEVPSQESAVSADGPLKARKETAAAAEARPAQPTAPPRKVVIGFTVAN